jgi:hypothetical protein
MKTAWIFCAVLGLVLLGSPGCKTMAPEKAVVSEPTLISDEPGVAPAEYIVQAKHVDRDGVRKVFINMKVVSVTPLVDSRYLVAFEVDPGEAAVKSRAKTTKGKQRVKYLQRNLPYQALPTKAKPGRGSSPR